MNRTLLTSLSLMVSVAFLVGCSAASPSPTPTLVPPTPQASPVTVGRNTPVASPVPTVAPLLVLPTPVTIPAPADYQPKYTGGPRLAVEKDSLDFGQMAYDQPVEAMYVIQNVGNAPLTFRPPLQVTVKEGC